MNRTPLFCFNGGGAAYEQALVCLSNEEILDVSRGRPFHCKMANCRLFSLGAGLIYLAI